MTVRSRVASGVESAAHNSACPSPRYARAKPETAVTADSGFARAYLGLGQALLWAADSTPDATRDRTVIARRTAELLGRLGTADGALLLAQQAMFERRWPDACRQYREIVEL